MRNFLTTILALVISASAAADGRVYLGPQVTYQFWDKNRFLSGLDDDNGIQLGLNLGYLVTDANGRKSAFEFATQTDASDTNAEADVYELNTYLYFGESSGGTTPYIVAGFSHINMDPTVVIDKATTNSTLGLGLSRFLDDALELRGDMRFRTAIGSHAVGQIHDLGINLALNYYFGRSGEMQASSPIVASTPAPVPTPTPVVERAPTPAPAAAPAPAPRPQVREVTVELDLLFETNSSIITDLDDAEFRRMADALEENPDVTLTIEGHTDSDGSAEYNETLSQRRADRVKTALVEQYGAPENRITAIGYGEARPIATNETAAGKAQNRRVVGVITYQIAQ